MVALELDLAVFVCIHLIKADLNLVMDCALDSKWMTLGRISSYLYYTKIKERWESVKEVRLSEISLYVRY